MYETSGETVSKTDRPVYELSNLADRIIGEEEKLMEVGRAGGILARINALLALNQNGFCEDIDISEELSARLLPDLIVQYNEWANNMDEKIPSLTQVLGSFTNEKFEVAGSFQMPYLLMLPVKEDGTDEIIGYQPVIAEGIPNKGFTPDDDREALLGDRIEARKKNRKPGEEGMNGPIYDLLHEAAQDAGKPIDSSLYTMFDDIPEGALEVQCAITFGGKKMIYQFSLAWRYDPAGFRSTTRGDVLHF